MLFVCIFCPPACPTTLSLLNLHRADHAIRNQQPGRPSPQRLSPEPENFCESRLTLSLAGQPLQHARGHEFLWRLELPLLQLVSPPPTLHTGPARQHNHRPHAAEKDEKSLLRRIPSVAHARRNGSYYYANDNGSTYYSSPSGQGTYTPPPGKR